MAISHRLHELALVRVLGLSIVGLTAVTASTISNSEQDYVYPSPIHLRAGVFHVPPYIFVEEFSEEDGSVLSVSGFCRDMWERLQIFAWEMDNITLDYEFKLAPNTYDGALDLVANDCQLGSNNTTRDCEAFDVIAVDYYYTAERAMRVDYSPVWLHGAISAVKYVPSSATVSTAEDNVLSTYVDVQIDADGDATATTPAAATANSGSDFITMSQASREGYPVCLVGGTSIVPIAQTKFPGINYLMCVDQQACIDQLKRGDCRLYIDDRLQLRYRAVADSTLVVSSETFNPQYITWVFNEHTMAPLVTRLLKKWLVAAHQNGTLGELYERYFEKQPCPPGRAGPNCDLPCNEQHGQADLHGTCVCNSPKWSGVDCNTPVPEDLHLIPRPLLVVAYCLLGINAVVIVGCALWILWNRRSQQVRISQPHFLLLVLLGCAISSSTILALGQQDTTADGSNSVTACMAIPWLYSVGFCVTFGTLFTKIRRVYIIFKTSAQMKRVKVTFVESLAVVGFVLGIDLIILIVWTVMDPLQWQRTIKAADQFGEPLESEGYCTSEHWLVFAGAIAALHLVLLLVASWMCYVSRHIPTKFSEGKYVSIAMLSNLQIFLVGIPVLIVVGSDPAASFFVRSVVIWMNDLVVVTLIFGNLIYSASYFGSEERQVKEEIGAAIQEFSRHNHHSDDEMNCSWHSGISLSSITGVLSHHSKGHSHNSTSASSVPPHHQQQPHDMRQVNQAWQASHCDTLGNLSVLTHDKDPSPPVMELDDEENPTPPKVIVSSGSSGEISAIAHYKNLRASFLERDSWAQDQLSADEDDPLEVDPQSYESKEDASEERIGTDIVQETARA